MPRLFALLVVLSGLTSLTGADPGCDHCPRAKRRVYVTVTAEYENRAWDFLPFAAKDTREFANVLEEKLAFEPLRADLNLTEPMLPRLLPWFEELAAAVDPDDDLVVFITGHGSDDGSFVPVDAPARSDLRKQHVITGDEMVARLFALRARRVLVILHFCYSGRFGTLTPVALKPNTVRQAIASGYAQVPGADPTRTQASPFANALVRYLSRRVAQFDPKRTCSAAEIVREIAASQPDPSTRPRLLFERPGADFLFDLDAKERADWERALANPGEHKDGLRAYLKAYPRAIFRREALAEIERSDTEKREGRSLHSYRGSLRGRRPEDVRRNLNDHDQTYVWIPEGSAAGVPGCATGRTAGGFWITQYETTVGAYREKGRLRSAPGFNRGWVNNDLPVVNVSLADAELYCSRVDPNGRVPTSCDWSYAVRANQQPIEDLPPPGFLRSMANLRGTAYDDATSGDHYAYPVKGGTFPRDTNGWQLYDIVGNVREMIAPARQNQGSGQSGSARTPLTIETRGGSYADTLDMGRFSKSDMVDARGTNTVGFRCVIPYTEEQ